MICRLFEFEVDTGKQRNVDVLVKTSDCPRCHGDTCVLCKDLNTKKTRHRYSWTVSRRLIFPEDYGDEVAAIKFIHPTQPQFWIVKKIKDGNFMFSLVADSPKDSFDAIHLAELNYQMKNRLDFDGKEIMIGDFE